MGSKAQALTKEPPASVCASATLPVLSLPLLVMIMRSGVVFCIDSSQENSGQF